MYTFFYTFFLEVIFIYFFYISYLWLDELGSQSTIVSEGFKGGTRGSPIMPRDLSLSDSKCRNGGQKWVKYKIPVLKGKYR